MGLSTRAEIEIARPIEQVFARAGSCQDFPRFMLPYGPIPGVASALLLDAPAPKAGARREVRMTDGSRMEEELLAYEPPSRHRYRWVSRPAPPFGWLLEGAEGDWSFTPTAGGTRVVWVYRFEPTSALAGLLARPLLALFRRWMEQALARLGELVASQEMPPRDSRG